LHAGERPTWVEGPRAFREVSMAAKPAELTWYAYDVTIRSPTEVTFAVYGMHSFPTGCVGEMTATFQALVAAEVTAPAIPREAMRLARCQREEETAQAEDEIVRRYVEAIFAEAPTPANAAPGRDEAATRRSEPK